MKKILIVLAFLSSTLSMLPQQNFDENDYIASDNEYLAQNSILQKMRSRLKSGAAVETRYFRLKFHIISKSDGSEGLDINLLPKVVKMLNEAFAPAKIQFVNCTSINYIKSDRYFMSDTYADRDNLWRKQNDTMAINLYFLKNNSHRGWMNFGRNDNYGAIKNDNALIVAPHEMGHFFGLYHTFETHDTIIGTDTIPILENVARSGADCNCSTAGDKFCDTPADPGGYSNGWCYFTGVNIRDSKGALYAPDPKNIMSYFFCEDKTNDGQLGTPGTLLSHFSTQQNQYMSSYADSSWNNNRKITPQSNKTYTTSTSISSTDAIILRDVKVSGTSKVSVSACDVIIDNLVEISNTAILEIK